jgi:predicted P-loop ATPase
LQNTKTVYAASGVDASKVAALRLTTWPALRITAGVEAPTTWEELRSEFQKPPRVFALDQLKKKDDGSGLWKKPDGLALFSLATFTGSKREGKSVEAVHAAVCEHDAGNLTPDDIRRAWGHLRGFAYTTFNSTAAARRWRVVLELTETIEAARWPAVFAQLRETAAAAGAELDESAKDAGRGWFVPAHPEGEEFLFVTLDGEPLEPAQPELPHTKSAPVRVRQAAKASPSNERARYLAILDKAAEAVRAAPVGSRNEALNREAFAMGGYVAAGFITEEEAANALLDAITMNGGGGPDDERKISDGIRKGKEKPREPLEDRPRTGVVRALRSAPSRPANDANSWRDKLAMTKNGEGIRKVLANLLLIIEHDERLEGIAYDEFRQAIVRRSSMPWPTGAKQGRWTDEDDTRLAAWIFTEYDIDFSPNTIAGAVKAVGRGRSFSPVRDYLNGLRWDGVPRIDGLLVKYTGAAATPYHQVVGSKFMVAAVARAMEPGCQVDTMLVLEDSTQGFGKSTFFRVLASPEYFTDDLADPSKKDAAEQLPGAWFVEMAELSSMRKADVETLKAFLTRRVDRYRPSYGHHVIEQPRGCVFVGTTNETEYLKDATGNRRFWPVATTTIDLDALARDRDQLWAEAVQRYRAGERWHIESTDPIWTDVQAAQADRFERDPWEEKVRPYAEQRGPNGVTLAEILTDCLGIEVARQDQREKNRAAKILVAMRWQRKKASVNSAGRRLHRYYPPLIYRE